MGGMISTVLRNHRRRDVMAWLIRELKRFATWIAIFFVICLLLVVGIFGIFVFEDRISGTLNKLEQDAREEDVRMRQKEQADAWQKWLEQQKAKNAQQQAKKEPPAPGWENGFKSGYIAGYSAAAGGAVKPSGAEVDALARGQATKENVPEGERTAWKMGFSTGWTFG